MATINQLSTADTLTLGDLTVIFSTNNGDSRKTSLSTLKSFILDNFISSLETRITSLEDLDDFAVYDVSQSATVKLNSSVVRDYVRDNIFTNMTDGSTVTDDDLFMTLESTSGVTQSITGAELIAYLSGDLRAKPQSQQASPSATGFNVQINDNSSDTHLILTPTTNFAAGTITLPAIANVIDKQEVLVNCTQQVGTLTIDKNGAVSVTGAPTALGADDYFRLKYDTTTSTWFRVG